MDNAALSARFAVQAVLEAEKCGTVAFSHYARKMERMKCLIEVNEEKRRVRFASNDTLTTSMNPYPMLIAGVRMGIANFANRFLPPEKIITLPL